jgi:hypothetical protein
MYSYYILDKPSSIVPLAKHQPAPRRLNIIREVVASEVSNVTALYTLEDIAGA